MYQLSILIRTGLFSCIIFCVLNVSAQEIRELELRSDALVLPRTVGSLVNNPIEGMLIYNGDSNTLYYYDGTSWEEVGGGFTRNMNIIHQYNTDGEDVFIFGRKELPEDDPGGPNLHDSKDELKANQSTTGKFFFFDEGKGVFRGGELTDVGLWGPSNLGENSFAYGTDVLAFGQYSTALGWNTEAIGFSALALGEENRAVGFNSIALGRDAEAIGTGSISIGEGTIAHAQHGLVIGQDNDTLVTKGYNGSDKPLFIIGNGTTSINRSNAMVVRQNGEVEFSNYKFPIDDGSSGQILRSNGNGQLIWTNANNAFDCPSGYEEVSNFCIEADVNSGGQQNLQTAIETCAAQGGQVPTYQQFYLAVDAAVLNTTSGANRRHWMEDLVYTTAIRGTTALEKFVGPQSISVTPQNAGSNFYFRCIIEK